jgi:3-methyladenine DNA glycosylase AlkD
MVFEEVMGELQALGTERMKKMYMKNGAQEPLFGVATGAMKPMAKRIKNNQPLAEQLYATNNYDAMYFAGVIAEPNKMSEEDYERWIKAAYFYMLSDYVVAVTLAEAEIGESLATKWISSDQELKQSAGWSCYCWMLGNRKDETFNLEDIQKKLALVEVSIHTSLPRVQIAMNNFVETVGISFKPLHSQALETARAIGEVKVEKDNGKVAFINSYQNIEKQIEKGRIGFKRRYVRC